MGHACTTLNKDNSLMLPIDPGTDPGSSLPGGRPPGPPEGAPTVSHRGDPARFTVAPDASEDAILSQALAHERVRAQVEGKAIRKTLVVPGRLVSIVV